MSKQIPLTQGKFAIVDDEDYDRISEYKWHLFSGRYAATRIGLQKITMHRLVLLTSLEIDHIDGNGLNNQRENLRACSHSENMKNRVRHKNNTNEYKGIEKTGRNSWRAVIVSNSQKTILGVFHTPEDAARAYDVAAREKFGIFAKTNF
jgi:hypothetical protein